tara:strand:- start:729 stop:953 length:225 start_codon:yes stop_codon:yes gene_type:complete
VPINQLQIPWNLFLIIRTDIAVFRIYLSNMRSKLFALLPFPYDILAILPVIAKYPIAPINNPKAIRFGTIPPMI